MTQRLSLAFNLLTAAALSACASLPNADALKVPRPPGPQTLQSLAPASWQTPLSQPLPHQGSPAALKDWWARFNDPLLVSLIEKSQALSPSLAAAKARIAGADAARVAANSALGPSAAAQVLTQRSNRAGGTPESLLQAGVAASWELDLFGKNQAGLDASTASLQSAQAAWHDARVSLAADVGRTYLALRLCEQQVQLLVADAASRQQTQNLNEVTAKAGLLAPATLALGQASVAEAQSRVNAQQLACGGLGNALNALSGVPTADLMANVSIVQPSIQSNATKSAVIPSLYLDAIPANVLRQRPDLARAERDVLASAAQISQADGALKPTISLGGNLGASRISAGGFTQDGPSWSLGPVSITMPLLASKSLQAAALAARATHEANEVAYRGAVAQAVRETNDALGTLASVAQRATLNTTAVNGYRAHLKATQARYGAGLANLIELEEARRIALNAEQSVLALEQERVGAWINLYRAAGGGWERTP